MLKERNRCRNIYYVVLCVRVQYVQPPLKSEAYLFLVEFCVYSGQLCVFNTTYNRIFWTVLMIWTAHGQGAWSERIIKLPNKHHAIPMKLRCRQAHCFDVTCLIASPGEGVGVPPFCFSWSLTVNKTQVNYSISYSHFACVAAFFFLRNIDSSVYLIWGWS